MKLLHLVFLCLLLVAVSTSEPRRRRKKPFDYSFERTFFGFKPRKSKSLSFSKFEDFAGSNNEAEEEPVTTTTTPRPSNENPFDVEWEHEEEMPEEEQEDAETDNQEHEEVIIVQDPCRKLRCGAGRECQIDAGSGEAHCGCVQECGYETDPRRQVCSNHNETFATDCELYQLRCFCEDGDDRCTNAKKFKHVHIEYYGACRVIPKCSVEELSDFPRRMREWLFNVMQELAERRELSEHYRRLEKEAEKDISKRWQNAAIWKWCELNEKPHDNVVSRHELFPVRAPLLALEHCIADFLDGCDVDGDHEITLEEWGACLELDEDDLTEKCEKLE